MTKRTVPRAHTSTAKASKGSSRWISGAMQLSLPRMSCRRMSVDEPLLLGSGTTRHMPRSITCKAEEGGEEEEGGGEGMGSTRGR